MKNRRVRVRSRSLFVVHVKVAEPVDARTVSGCKTGALLSLPVPEMLPPPLICALIAVSVSGPTRPTGLSPFFVWKRSVAAAVNTP